MFEDMKINIENDTDIPILISIEPWAEEFTVSPKSILNLNCLCKNEGSPIMKIEYHTDLTSIWFWGGTKVEVRMDGELLETASSEFESPF